jgi:hypothetical protein
LSKRNKGKRKIKQKYPEFEFKPQQVNDSSQSNQGTDHLFSQLANCGFSKAVMSHGGEAVLLTPEHEVKLLAPTVVGGISVQSPMPVSCPNRF